MAEHLRDATKKMDFISREAAFQAIEEIDENAGARGSGFTDPERIMRDSALYALEAIKPADVVEVVRCKNCKHRPVVVSPSRPYGFGLAGPGSDPFSRDETCPYLCDDGYYNRMPDDDGFCNLGEAKDD